MTKQIRLRDHQKKALASCHDGLRKHPRGQVIMATSTGKTLLALWAARAEAKTSILLLVPSLALARQTYQEWRRPDVRDNAEKLPWLVVCSDPSVTEDENPAQELRDTEELCGEVMRDPKAIHAFLIKKQKQPLIVVSTYQSAPILAEGLPRGFRFDIAIFDEAHKTAGSAGKLFAHALLDANIPCKKRLFFTATPRRANLDQKKEGRDIFHMNDKGIYGPVFYDLSFNEAKQKGLVCGYDVVLAVIQAKGVNRAGINADSDQALFAKVLVASAAAKKYGIKKMFSFHDTNLNAAKAEHLYRRQARGYAVKRVEGRQGTRVRDAILGEFAAAKKAIVTNARCLSEGVNVPSCDGVAFMTPRRSRIDVVQTVGRGTRPAPGKVKTYVILPIFLEAGETLEEATRHSSFGDAVDTLRHLKDYNKSLSDDIRETKGYVAAPESKRGPQRIDEDRIHIFCDAIMKAGIAGMATEAFKKAFKVAVADLSYGKEEKIADILDLAERAYMAKRGLA